MANKQIRGEGEDSIGKIKDWQLNFYRGIFEPTKSHINNCCDDIQQTSQLSAESRLAIYRNSILGGITSGLMGIYPVCTRLVGESFFSHMVSGYLRQYPSNSPDVGQYGESLADYLDHFLVAVNQQQELIYLPDVARLEWLWHKAFNAPDIGSTAEGESTTVDESKVMPLTELANIHPDNHGQLIFKLLPSLGLLSSRYPIDKIWRINQAPMGSGDEKHEEEIELSEDEREFVIWRSADFAMHIEKIAIPGGLAFLNDVQQGMPFAQIAANNYSSPVEELLPHFLQSGLIVGFNH